MANKKLFLVTGATGSGKTVFTKAAAKALKMKLGHVTTDNPKEFNSKSVCLYVSPDEFDAKTYAITYIDTDGYRCGITEDELNSSDVFSVNYNALAAFGEKYSGDREVVSIGIASNVNSCRERMAKKYPDDLERILAQGKMITAQLTGACDRVIMNDCDFYSTLARLKYLMLSCMYVHDPVIERQAYDTYCSEWLLQHGITTRNIVSLIAATFRGGLNYNTGDDLESCLLASIERSYFRDETMKTFDEFLETEYASPEYRDRLLGRMQRQYRNIDLLGIRIADCMPEKAGA